ncbi:precorrin-2 dehydrogenase/sirohydrochlorin ferrochelatase family protein [Sporocytophaga myxococcoides]|uniref:precorrin-2 dehydrogenase/sirohydrochlorin ferrochelatase family protein n=1 Tax=Sporocytophaga myxococcoides TaxID=153721 RepID=UPI0005677C49|nr:bifunctional precorrin-2 dehydrogenase/sirohydrochlorin ferrochelatase [Sporocytophaga myxococcoides]
MNHKESNDRKGNQLFPVFFKLEHLQVLVVGGGFVGLEKVSAIYKNCQKAQVTLVAPEIKDEIRTLALEFPLLKLEQREYQKSDLNRKDLVIAATSIRGLNKQVHDDAKVFRVLCNIADTPDLCDFYLSSVVQKGDLKIAVSTNGKSPTFAKRMREMLEDILPDSIDKILANLNQIREKLRGDFEYKVKKLDEITSVLKEKDKFDQNK